MRLRPSICGPLVALTTVAGCSGHIEGRQTDPQGDVPAGDPDQPRPGMQPGAPPVLPALDEAVGPARVRLLRNREYENTARDLLGLETLPPLNLPNESVGASGFTEPSTLTALAVEAYARSAAALAKAAVDGKTVTLSCQPEDEPCLARFVTDLATRAFRRPPAQAQVDDLVALYRNVRMTIGLGAEDSLVVLLQALLESPHFLFRGERPARGPAPSEIVRLDDHEIAARLSYLLWQSGPDDALRAAAAAGELQQPSAVAQQVDRMLQDRARVERGLFALHRAWLHLHGLEDLQKDASLFPAWDATAARDVARGFDRFIAHVLLGGGTYEELFTKPLAFVSRQTAPLYGIVPPEGLAADALAPAQLNPEERSGLLTHLAFLTAHATPTASDPIERGAVIWKHVLCGEMPPPPPDAPAPEPPRPDVPARVRLKAHAKNACAGCHVVIDPPGLALEAYDAAGRFRTMEGGAPVDASGQLETPGGQMIAFSDARDFSAGIAASADLPRCVARTWFRFSQARPETPAEEALLAHVEGALGADGFTLNALVHALTRTPGFRARRLDEGEGVP